MPNQSMCHTEILHIQDDYLMTGSHEASVMERKRHTAWTKF